MGLYLFENYEEQLPEMFRSAFPDAKVFANNGQATGTPVVCALLRNPQDVSEVAAKVAAVGDAKLLCLSTAPNAQEAFAVFRQGAKGYCHAMAPESLVQQVVTVLENGGIWVGPEFMPALLSGLSSTLTAPQSADVLCGLCPRERDVAEQVVKGISNKEVARALDITERTVKAHLSAIFEKLEVRDRVHLILKLKQSAG